MENRVIVLTNGIAYGIILNILNKQEYEVFYEVNLGERRKTDMQTRYHHNGRTNMMMCYVGMCMMCMSDMAFCDVY